VTEITILAVSRLSDGVCVAGITDDGQWVRPTRPNKNDSWRQLESDDCKDNKGNWIIRKGNRVRMHLTDKIPEEAHSEDWLIGDKKPQLIEELSDEDYKTFCEKFTEDSLDVVDCENAKRSLILIHPCKITSFSFAIETNLEGQRKYIPRCNFKLGDRTYLQKGISDLEWRGHGRQIMQEHGVNCSIQASEIFEQNSTKDCWFTIGRNPLKSRFYLLIAGVHFFPVRHFDMDFKR
jgi:hypothetical protein